VDLVLAWQLRERPAAAQRVSADRARADGTLIEPFDVLFEVDLPRYRLPDDLEKIYGQIGFAAPILYSNFVMSLDGVVSLGSVSSAGSSISGKYQADRFLMALLRACAGAVLVGAGTLRATPGHHWTPEHVFPALEASFAELRRSLGLAARPRLVLFTASGKLDVSHPAVVDGATIVTSARGAQNLKGHLPDSCDIIEIGEREVDVAEALTKLRGRGYDVMLTEGGPHLTGELVKAGLLDEAFLTISPVVAGRDVEERLGMVAGVEFLPHREIWSRLASARRHGDFLFLRYDLRKSARP
jgi:riboflavin biosynthesis pyrimidine reductase